MNLHWVYDVVTEHAALTTTGGRVWDAARRLCSFLEEMGPELGLHRPGLRVLELGSGLGWLGMTLARNLLAPAEVVVLTEQEEGGGLAWLRHNLALNAHLPGMGAVTAEPCDWRRVAEWIEQPQGQMQAQPCSQQGQEGEGGSGLAVPQSSPADVHVDDPRAMGDVGNVYQSLPVSPPLQPQLQTQVYQSCPTPVAVHSHPECSSCSSGSDPTGPRVRPEPATDLEPACTLCSQQWDLVLGSDLVYNDVGADCLPRVMRALAGPGTRILYCHTKHRFDTHDMKFFSQLAACGLECREVHEPSVSSPPPSPPPLTELFPDMRIAVYDIRLAR